MSYRARALCLGLLTLGFAACARATHPAVVSTGDARIDSDLDRLRAATVSYQHLDSAVTVGYPRDVPACIVHEHHGAMGYHHLNRRYLTATPRIDQPQILLYERMPDGAYKLNGVEFIVPYRLYSRDSVPPVLFGQKLHHEDNLNYWYLHVWAWTNNAEGVFANFNPSVSCGTTGKVYTPFTRP